MKTESIKPESVKSLVNKSESSKDNEEEKVNNHFSKFNPRKSVGLSVITHTPTEHS